MRILEELFIIGIIIILRRKILKMMKLGLMNLRKFKEGIKLDY
jgi:hypothetical protein